MLAFGDSPAGAAAAVLAYEGWTPPDGADVPADEAARRAAGERTYHARPDRVEARMLIAVDINARVYAVQRRRGGQPDVRGPDGAQARGRIPWALGRLAAAMRAGAWPAGGAA